MASTSEGPTFPAAQELGTHSAPKQGLFLGALLVLLVLVAYWPALQAGFVWDDTFYVSDNEFLRSVDGLYRLWFTADFYDYYPLSTTTLWLEWQAWGANAIGYHATNVVLHAACGLLIWRVLRRLRVPGAWLAAAVFAVHPVNVESVAWISERKNVLSMLFYLLAALLFLKSEEEPRKSWYWTSVLMFLLALLSKISVVMLPVVLLGFAWWQRRTITRRDWIRSLPFFLLSLAVGSVVVMWFQFGQGWVGDTDPTGQLLGRLAGVGWAVWFYLGKTILPLHLSIAYPQWNFDPYRFASHVPTILLGFGLWVCWRYRARWGRACLFGIGYFLVSVFPALCNAFPGQIVYSPVADHWQHLAIIGTIALVVSAGVTGFRHMRFPQRGPGVVVAGMVLGILSMLTWRQAGVFHNEETLARNLLRENPRFWGGHYNLGIVLSSRKQTAEAIAEYETALRSLPKNAEQALPMQCVLIHNNLALALAARGRVAEAIEHLQTAVRIQPDFAPAYYNLGVLQERMGHSESARASYQAALRYRTDYAEAHNNLALLLSAEGHPAEALAHVRDALRSKPEYAPTYYNLGLLQEKMGQPAEAQESYQTALRLKPDFAEAHYNLGLLLQRNGNLRAALDHYDQAVRSKPEFAKAWVNKGILLLSANQLDAAAACFQQALRANPEMKEAHGNLGTVYAAQGNIREAIRQFDDVVRLSPDDPDAHFSLATALASQGDETSACVHYRIALRLRPHWAECLNDLAWLLATSKNPEVRDGDAAVPLAEEACRLTNHAQPHMLNTRAAAYAAAGNWERAVLDAQQARDLAVEKKDTKLAREIESRLALYREANPAGDVRKSE